MRPLSLAHLTLGAPPFESIDAAADAGFAALGIRIAPRRPAESFPLRVLGSPETTKAIRSRARDAGVIISNVSAYQFFPDTRWDDVQPVIAAAHEIGAQAIVAYSFDPEETRFLEIFSRYCAEAHAAGMTIALEFMPYSATRTLGDALALIERSGATNARVLVDALHLHRSGGSVDDLRRVDPSRIAFAQLCDAPRTAPRTDAELIAEARTARRPPGEGDLPLFAFVDALPAGTEIEYECAPADRANWSAVNRARAAREDVDRFTRAYEADRARRSSAPA